MRWTVLVGLLTALPSVCAAQTMPAVGALARAAAQGSSDEFIRPTAERRRARAEAATASATPATERRARRQCLRPAVTIRRLRGGDLPTWTGALTDCSGRPTLRAMAALGLLAQPGRPSRMDLPAAVATLRRLAPAAGLSLSDDVPVTTSTSRRGRSRNRGAASATTTASATTVPRDPHTHDPVIELSEHARAPHPRLVQLLQAVMDRFPGRMVEIVSGYRPGDGASRHAHARALDLRLRGVRYEELRDFARTLPDAGVGYYPNSVFVHLDVRDPSEGRAFWADYSGPGERPRYGAWPPADQDVQREVDWIVTQHEGTLRERQEREWSPEALRAPPAQ